MKKEILLALSIMTLSSATSSGALVLSFAEEGADVVMSTSGFINLDSMSSANSGFVVVTGDLRGNGVNAVNNSRLGPAFVYLADMTRVWSFAAESGDVSGANLFAFASSYAVIPAESGVFSSTMEIRWSDSSLSAMGFDSVPKNVQNPWWSQGSEAITFVVVTPIPEPSSSALLSLCGLGLLLRHRRS